MGHARAENEKAQARDHDGYAESSGRLNAGVDRE